MNLNHYLHFIIQDLILGLQILMPLGLEQTKNSQNFKNKKKNYNKYKSNLKSFGLKQVI